jgi:tetratricopeptide (TPR) repeat protein
MDLDRILQSAEKLAARNRFKQAIQEYRKVLAHSPNDARLLLRIGDLYTRTQAYPWAVDSYAHAGRIYAQEGFAAKAVAVYKQVQHLVDKQLPHLADYYLFVYPTLAHLYQELRLPNEALGMYDAYASILAQSGRLQEASTILEVVVERGGDNPLTRLRLAEMLLETGEESDAVTHFLSAVDKLVDLDRVDEALRVLDHTLGRVPAPELARRAAEIHLDRGQGDDGMQALLRLQQAFQAQPKNLDTLALLARAFEAIGQKDRAFEVRKETVRIAKDQGALAAARTVLDTLMAEAPRDPAVIALAQTLAPPPIPQESSLPEVSVELVESAPFDRHAVLIEGDVPVIEEAHLPGMIDLQQEIASLELRAREFAEQGRIANAIHTLRIGLELDPDSVALRTLLESLPDASTVPSHAVPTIPRDDMPSEVPSPMVDAPPIPSSVLADIDLMARAPLESLRGFRGGGGVSEAIEEAEFFASRGLFDDALAIVQEQLERHPGDTDLERRVEEIRDQAADAEPQPSVLGVAIPTELATRIRDGADPEFLQTALAELDAPATAPVAAGSRATALDVDGLFDAIKQGIAEQVEEKDSEMHYDLGLAYLEMGRVNDAIDAFGKAALDPERACVSLSMVASVHQRQGNLGGALEALLRAARVPRKSRAEEVGVHYELASLYAQREDTPLAIEHFEQVVRLAPDFRDARPRLEVLRKRAGVRPTPALDDEFERAFDGLLASGGEKPTE